EPVAPFRPTLAGLPASVVRLDNDGCVAGAIGPPESRRCGAMKAGDSGMRDIDKPRLRKFVNGLAARGPRLVGAGVFFREQRAQRREKTGIAFGLRRGPVVIGAVELDRRAVLGDQLKMLALTKR